MEMAAKFRITFNLNRYPLPLTTNDNRRDSTGFGKVLRHLTLLIIQKNRNAMQAGLCILDDELGCELSMSLTSRCFIFRGWW